MTDVPLPGPKPWPVVGNLPALARDTLGFIQDCAGYGDRVQWSSVGDRLIQLHHPDDIEEVLLRHRKSLHKDPVTSDLRRALGDGLLTAEGEKWRSHRKMIGPSFTPRNLEAYGEAMVKSALEDLPETGSLDAHDWMSRITLNIVLRTLFGAEPGGQADEVGRLLEIVMVSFDIEYHSAARLLPLRVPLPHRIRHDRAIEQLNALLATVITERRERGPGPDMLWKLIEARDEAGGQFTDSELRDEALTLFVAGHETTSLALGYTLWQLARQPALQDQLQSEIAEVLGGRNATTEDVSKLVWTRAAIDESMRLYPPAWTVGRLTLEPITLADGFTIPEGYGILLPQFVVHRDERWWKDPLTYRPERWRNGETDQRPRFAYFPFGGGPRVCVGNHFALMEAVLVLATIMGRYRLTVDPAFHPELMPAVTMRPKHGLPLLVQRLDPSG